MSTNDRVSSSNLSKQRDVAHSACTGINIVFNVDREEFKSMHSLVISEYLWISCIQWTENGRCKVVGDGNPLGFMRRWIIDISKHSASFYRIAFELFSNRCGNLEFLFLSVAFNLMIEEEPV